MRNRKIADRERKRAERQAKADAGIPDPRQVKDALAYSLKAALVTCVRSGQMPVRVWFKSSWVLRGAMRDLCVKTVKGRPLNRRACSDAIRAFFADTDGQDLSSLGIGPRVPPIEGPKAVQPADTGEFNAIIRELMDLVDEEP